MVRSRLTVKLAVRVAPSATGSLTEMLLIVSRGGPSSSSKVPRALQVPSKHWAPTMFANDTNRCSLGSTTASPQTAMLTLSVPFGVLGGMLKGTLVNWTKSMPGPHAVPPVAGLKPAPVRPITDTVPVTVLGCAPTKRTGRMRIRVPVLPSNTLASSTNKVGGTWALARPDHSMASSNRALATAQRQRWRDKAPWWVPARSASSPAWPAAAVHGCRAGTQSRS